jgi:hypothetical protein
MIMRSTNSVSHGSQLVAVGVKPFLAGLLRAHVCPFAVYLGDDVVDVSDVAGLGGVEFWERIQEVWREGVGRVLSLSSDR